MARLAATCRAAVLATCVLGGAAKDFLGRAEGAPRQLQAPQAALVKWTPLGGGNRVANNEGDELFQASGSVEKCGQICSMVPGCRSYAYCGDQACFMKTGVVTDSSSQHFNQFCTTYYNPAPAASTSAAPPATSEPTTPSTTPATSQPTTPSTSPAPPPATTPAAVQPTCYKFSSKLVMNQNQRWASNPDAQVTGIAKLTLCDDGNMTATLNITGGASKVIAAHIQRCEGGSTPQTRTSVLCAGNPVINFCGDNTPGLIQDGTPYPKLCADYDDAGDAVTSDVRGALVAGANETSGMTAADLVRDIYAHPDLYFFNVHTMASYNHWYPDYVGMVRGPLVSENAKAAEGPTSAPPGEAEGCFSVFSQMLLNELQVFTDNPDSNAGGYVNLQLCTNGTARATMLVFGGKTQIIATHIHLCKGGDTPQTRTGDLCEGAPVMNFCGDNSPGMIADGTPYTQPCEQWGPQGVARNAGMPGVLVEATNKGITMGDRVRHILANPERYYFNVHTLADYNHWYPKHNGACRGPLQLASWLAARQ